DAAVPIVDTTIVCAPGRVVCVGTIACISAEASASSKTQPSSIKFRSDCSPCRESSVGGCGLNLDPRRGIVNSSLPWLLRLEKSGLKGNVSRSMISTCSSHLFRAFWPVCAVDHTRRPFPVIIRWIHAAKHKVVFPDCRGTLITTSGQRGRPSGPSSPITSAAYSCQGIGLVPSISITLQMAGPHVGPVGRLVACRGVTKLPEGFTKLVICFSFSICGCHSQGL